MSKDAVVYVPVVLKIEVPVCEDDYKGDAYGYYEAITVAVDDKVYEILEPNMKLIKEYNVDWNNVEED